MTALVRPHHTSQVDLDDLDERLTGAVLRAGTDAYAASATPWNVAVVPEHLAAIEVADAADVAVVVGWAGRHGLSVTVQATGHGAHRTHRPGLLVLTHRLDELTIDPVTRTARIGAGIHWSQVLDAAAPHGLAGLAGSAPNVGVVGYTTGGGLGPVARTYGWASDRVIAFDVVTGDGELRRVTATENPALFWALRGGKGALGIVTAVQMELVELAELYAGCLYFDGADAASVLHAWRTWAATLPEQANTSIAVLRLPPLPTVPPPLGGRTTIAVRYAWVGDPADGEQVLVGLGVDAPVIFGGVGPMPYTAMGMIHADPADPMPSTETATLLSELSAEAVDTLLAHVGPEADCPQLVVEMRLLGGAVARPPVVPAALSHRDAAFTLLMIGLGVPPVVDAARAHGDAVVEAMGQWSTGGNLPNFAPSADSVSMRRRYDAATYDRIGSLVQAYDPHRVLVAADPFHTD